MSKIVKKMKIMQSDGTLSDYVSIGAEAENINVDGESVEVKLSKKPYYYDTVADMKADTKLKAGDMAVTLGYYSVNDGGGAEYRIINGEYIDNGATYHELDNNLFAELNVATVETFINTKFLNLVLTETETDALNNFNKIKSVLEKGYNLIFDKIYPFTNDNTANKFNINRNLKIIGETRNCGFKFINTTEKGYFNLENGKIYLDNIVFNVTNGRVVFINNGTKGNVIFKYGDVNVTNCTFLGNFRLLMLYQSTIFAPDHSWGAGHITVDNCIIKNNPSTFISVYSMPSRLIVFNNNKVENFSHCLIFLMWNDQDGLSDEEARIVSQYIEGIEVKNNYVTNDDDWFGIGSAYYSVVAAKCRQCDIENNTVIGMKSIDGSTSLNPFYLTGSLINVKNNYCKNNINFSGYLNYILKSKAGLNSIKNYVNNTFILEEEWINTINNSLAEPYSEDDLKINCRPELFQTIVEQNTYNIVGNTFDYPYIKTFENSVKIKYFSFNNNKINCKTWKGALIWPKYDDFLSLTINDNVIYVTEDDGDFFRLINASDALAKLDIKVCNNELHLNCANITVINTPLINSFVFTDNIIINKGNSSNIRYFTTLTEVNEYTFIKTIAKTKGLEKFFQGYVNESLMDINIDYTGTIFNNAENFRQSHLNFSATRIFTEEKNYKIELSYDSENTQKLLRFYFTLYSQNNENYIRYKNAAGTTVDYKILDETSTTEYLTCETDSNFNNLLRFDNSSTGSFLNFRKRLFDNDNVSHNVKIKIQQI